jgi:hypothetical protein
MEKNVLQNGDSDTTIDESIQKLKINGSPTKNGTNTPLLDKYSHSKRFSFFVCFKFQILRFRRDKKEQDEKPKPDGRFRLPDRFL